MQEGEAMKAYGLIMNFDPPKMREGEATKAYGLIMDFHPPKGRGRGDESAQVNQQF